MSDRITISELAIPAAPGAPGWDELVTALGIHFDNEAASYDSDELRFTATEALPTLLDVENQPTRLFVARAGTRIVGLARYGTDPGDDPQTAWLMIDVLPSERNAGVGSALSEKLQGVAATDGIRKAIVYAVSPQAGGQQVLAPTGYGSVPAANPEVRFLLSKGYRLEQIARGSRLALPVDLGDALGRSIRDSGPDFAVHTWTDVTPDEWLEQMSVLRQLMSVEEPSAGLEEPEDPWTPERLREDEQLQAVSPRTRLFAAVEHVPSGQLAGFTVLSVPREVDRTVSQEDTLVRREFRGHRLGMLLKLANLDALQQRFPGHPAVITFNAEENRHMLEVNEALGFVPIGYEGAWRKDLPY